MKAVVFEEFGGPEVLQYVDLPMPTPGEGQVLVKMVSAGVCKADWRVRTGRCQWLTAPFPVTLGYEMAGRIEALGPGVTGFTIGEPVHVLHMACYGTYAEYMAVDAADVVSMAEGTDFDAAAAAFNYFVAWGLLNQIVEAKEGQSLYMGGAAGGVGTAVIQLAQLKKMNIVASASTDEKCEYLRGLGVGDVFNYKEDDDVAMVKKLTDGRGVDYVYDQVAGPRFCRQFDMLATYGQIVLYNFLGGYPEDKEIIHILQSRCEYCYGLRYFSIHVHDTDPEGFREMKRQVLARMAEGTLNPPIYKVLPLSEARRAHEMIESGEVLGKLVLHPEELT
ncbi:MAG: zinc-binding dehydrogenase [bacterium]